MTVIDTLKQTENKKRLRFLLKLAAYSLLLFLISNFAEQINEVLNLPEAVLNALMFYFTGHLIVSFVRILTVFYYIKKHHLNTAIKNNFVIGINRIADLLGVFVLLISMIIVFDKNPVEFITSLSIVAAAIAILSKDYIANMINGMIIMFSNEISIGDHVKIGNQKGKVMDITLTNIHLVNEDEDTVYIPNSLVLTSELINLTKRNVRKLSFDFDMKNDHLANVGELENALYEALKEYHQFIKKDTFNLKIVKINENCTSLKAQFIINKAVNIQQEKAIRRQTLRTVLYLINLQQQ